MINNQFNAPNPPGGGLIELVNIYTVKALVTTIIKREKYVNKKKGNILNNHDFLRCIIKLFKG